jgi:hypothetical protein
MKSPEANPISRLLWLGGEEVSLACMLARGALIWAAYSALQLWVNGVVIDEGVVPAQIIAGAVHYPPGHPHLVFYPQVFSLPNYLAAVLWRLVPNALLLSALRNFLFLFASAFLPFALALVLTRKPLWGHLAAALTLTETGLRFWGIYPMWVFPNFYSHGHIGMHVALLAVVFLLARMWGWAGFFLGLQPALHGAMIAVLWPWSFLYILFSSQKPRGKERVRFFLSAGVGLALTVGLAAITFARANHVAVAPPYDAQANGDLIYRNFTLFTDFHRHLFSFFTFGYLVNLVAFLTLGAILWRATRRPAEPDCPPPGRPVVFWLMLFGIYAWATVFGAALLQRVWGSLPGPVEQLMPYRFSNFSALLLLPLTAAALFVVWRELPEPLRRLARNLLIALLGVAGILLWLEEGPFDWLYRGRVAIHLIFIVWGVLFAMELLNHTLLLRRRLDCLFGVLVLAASTFLATPPSRVGVTLLASFFLSMLLLSVLLLVRRFFSRPHSGSSLIPHRPAFALLLIIALICAAALPGRRMDAWHRKLERWDMVSRDDRALRDWLAKNARPGEMLLPALWPRSELQPKTGHPVLMELETLYLMTYVPRLAPTIGVMAKDLYGMDYSDPAQLRSIAEDGRVLPETAWIRTWRERRQAEWQSLGQRYAFRLVLSPADVPLDLPLARPGNTWNLYTIPARSSPH